MSGIIESSKFNFVQFEDKLITSELLLQYSPGIIQVVNCIFQCADAVEGDNLSGATGFIILGSIANAEKITESCLAVISTMGGIDRYIGFGDIETGKFAFKADFSMYP